MTPITHRLPVHSQHPDKVIPYLSHQQAKRRLFKEEDPPASLVRFAKCGPHVGELLSAVPGARSNELRAGLCFGSLNVASFKALKLVLGPRVSRSLFAGKNEGYHVDGDSNLSSLCSTPATDMKSPG